MLQFAVENFLFNLTLEKEEIGLWLWWVGTAEQCTHWCVGFLGDCAYHSGHEHGGRLSKIG